MSSVDRGTNILVSLLAGATPVVAHRGHGNTDSDALAAVLPPLLFLVSVLVVAIVVSLDHQGTLDDRWADAGVLVGMLGVIGSVALLLWMFAFHG